MSFIKHYAGLLVALSLSAQAVAFCQDEKPKGEEPTAEAKPFQLGIEQKDFIAPPQPPPQNYGTPQMAGYGQVPPLTGGAQQQGLNGAVQGGPPPMMIPQNPTAGQMPPPQQNFLPPQFLGRWQVMGTRAKVEALPQFQAGMDSIFSINTQNIWIIQGNPQQGYSLSNDQGVQTSLMVQTQGDTALLRYQHPIRNTMAQEAVVMQLLPGGTTFNGIERISIVKQGEGVRAKVEYNLVGHRQR